MIRKLSVISQSKYRASHKMNQYEIRSSTVRCGFECIDISSQIRRQRYENCIKNAFKLTTDFATTPELINVLFIFWTYQSIRTARNNHQKNGHCHFTLFYQ